MANTSFRTPTGALVKYLEVTPAMAKKYLDANTNNRTLSDRQIDQYARALEQDDWPFTGDAIRIAEDGTLLDGQHRLFAIERSGKSMECLVVSGLDNKTQMYMDSGRKRQSSDYLTLHGVGNATFLSAAARMLMLWESWREQGRTISPTNIEVTEYVLSNIDALQSSRPPSYKVYRAIHANHAAVHAAYVRGLEVTEDPFLVANFFERLATGAELKLGEPVYALRNSILRRQDELTRNETLWMVVRAWNAEMRGESFARDRLQLPKRELFIPSNFPDMMSSEASKDE